MPWNNGDDNGQKKQEGPPDLDELLRKLEAKIRASFRKGFGNANSPIQSISNSNGKWLGFSSIFFILFVLWLLSGIYIVAPAERAVILRFGRYVDTVDPGPHWMARFIDSKDVVNVGNVDNLTYGGSSSPVYMLTRDENIVSVSVSVQYQVNNPKDYLFNLVNPVMSLKQATASALRQVIGQSTLDDVLTTGRAVIRQQVADQLNKILALYNTGIRVTEVAMQPATAPEEVKDKFDEAIRAQEDEQRFINQAEAYARSVIPIAEGNASRLLQEADAYKQNAILQAEGDATRFNSLLPEYQKNPQIVKQKLYLDTLESIFSKSNKLFVNVTKSNPMIYLPFDQITKRQTQIPYKPIETNSTGEDLNNKLQRPVVNRDETQRSNRQDRPSTYQQRGDDETNN